MVGVCFIKILHGAPVLENLSILNNEVPSIEAVVAYGTLVFRVSVPRDLHWRQPICWGINNKI